MGRFVFPLLLVVFLTACATFNSLGIQFDPGEQEQCARQQNCMVFTPQQLQRYREIVIEETRAEMGSSSGAGCTEYDWGPEEPELAQLRSVR